MKKKHRAKKEEVWVKNPLPAAFDGMWTVYNEIHLRFDGGCGPTNPGGVPTFGWQLYGVLNGAGDVIQEGWGACLHLPHHLRTNNTAEWAGVVDALEWMVEEKVGAHRLRIIGDSQLIINQVKGVWACKKDHLREAYKDAIKALSECCGSHYSAKWVPRALNAACDRLSNMAYNQERDNPDVYGD
jgi:ribonuclease HI